MLTNRDVTLTKLLEPFLETHLQSWPDEDSLPALCMELQARVTETQPQRPLEPLVLSESEDAGVLPNQQSMAQELLCRILHMTGVNANTCVLHMRAVQR